MIKNPTHLWLLARLDSAFQGNSRFQGRWSTINGSVGDFVMHLNPRTLAECRERRVDDCLQRSKRSRDAQLRAAAALAIVLAQWAHSVPPPRQLTLF
jgi:hypothetical protein